MNDSYKMTRPFIRLSCGLEESLKNLDLLFRPSGDIEEFLYKIRPSHPALWAVLKNFSKNFYQIIRRLEALNKFWSSHPLMGQSRRISVKTIIYLDFLEESLLGLRACNSPFGWFLTVGWSKQLTQKNEVLFSLTIHLSWNLTWLLSNLLKMPCSRQLCF